MKNIFRPTNRLFVIILLIIMSCGSSDEPIIPEPDNTNPIVTLTNISVVDNDGDGKINDITGTFTATDNVNVQNGSKTITAGGVSGFVSGNTFTITNVPAGNQTIIGKAEDTSGNTGQDIENITVPDQIDTSYDTETSVETNDINEETSGKIATLTTITKKIVTTNGNAVETTVTNGTVAYELTGPDKDLLEIKNGNEVHVKTGSAKDVEDSEGNDITANKTYNWGVNTVYTAPDNSNANDSDPNKVSNNLDNDDFEPFDAGLLIEKNGDIPTEYSNAIANPDNLITTWSESTDGSLLDKITEAAGSRFERVEFTLPSGNTASYISIDGKRLGLESLSRILDGIYKSLLPAQNAAMPNTSDRIDWLVTSDMTIYLAKGLNALTFTDYTGTSADSNYDAGAEIVCTSLNSGKVGAASNVARNIAIGAYD